MQRTTELDQRKSQELLARQAAGQLAAERAFQEALDREIAERKVDDARFEARFGKKPDC